jgi:hypothetical protein
MVGPKKSTLSGIILDIMEQTQPIKEAIIANHCQSLPSKQLISANQGIKESIDHYQSSKG